MRREELSRERMKVRRINNEQGREFFKKERKKNSEEKIKKKRGINKKKWPIN
jgi:hypothetical protein